METLDGNAESGQRPTFLTVLCILTFIGSGLGILGGLMGLIGSSALAMFTTEGTMLVQVMGLVAAALCLYGAIQMWGLKKQGFMMYVVGAMISILGAIVSALTFKSAMSSISSSLEGLEGFEGYNDAGFAAADSMVSAGLWMGVVIGIIINLAFVLMYNANKKHLVN
ncbi:MAG: hypothetical protein COA33_005020 [Fluviicola sp.]|nr:hypothetical protein [Fluviicola sp.]